MGFRIDFEGLEFRILDLPIPPGELSGLQVGTAGQVYYLKTVDGVTSINRYDLAGRKNETLLPANGYGVSADGQKLLYVQNNNWSIVSTTKPMNPSEGRIAADSIEVRIDPLAEWKQIFDEAWRINRDYFYAPNMHGVDWKAQRDKYAAFLPHVARRDDLNRILQWMSSELSVAITGWRRRYAVPIRRNIPGGLLGADYGRQRPFSLKKCRRAHWNPQLVRADRAGVNARRVSTSSR